MIPFWKREIRTRLAAAATACGYEVAPAAVVVERARNPKLGDYASTVALQLAKAAKRPPRELAAALVEQFAAAPWFERVTVDGPGFINLSLAGATVPELLGEVLAAGAAFGRSELMTGKRALVEFVSANPTGPLHIGHGRGAAYGDAVARLLAAIGYRVEREFYCNDAGNQIATLGRSLWARYRQLQGENEPIPDKGYHGEYLLELARGARDRFGEGRTVCDGATEEEFARFGAARLLEEIFGDLERFGVVFDAVFHESALAGTKDEAAVAALRAAGAVEEKDGALWLRSDRHGDEKPRVLQRADGRYTYLVPDIAYHQDKFARGYDLLLNVWGADHHGYLPRLRAALQFLGCDVSRLEVQFLQMVRLLEGGQEIKMSKRSGSFVTLRQVTDEVSTDVARWFFLMRQHESQLDFDLALAKKESDENPVYYVQYAHARICSIERNAPAGMADLPDEATLARLTEPEARDLVGAVARFPEEVADAALAREPQRLCTYLTDLTTIFHQYYAKHRVISDDAALTRARLALCRAVRLTLANGLDRLGISAPERMDRAGQPEGNGRD